MIFIMGYKRGCFRRRIPEKKESAAADKEKYKIVDESLILFFIRFHRPKLEC